MTNMLHAIPWQLPATLASAAVLVVAIQQSALSLARLARRPSHAPGHTRRLSALSGLVAGNPLLLVIAGIGFSLSFETIARLAAHLGMPGWPPLYPIGIDVAILALVIEARRAIDDDRSDLVPRIGAWILSALTIYVNALGASSWGLGRVLHIVMPCLWVMFLELTRWRKLRRQRAGRTDRIPRARWLADWPHRTLGMKRRMVLNNVRSYPVACAREEARMLAMDLARAEWGPKWKRDAPALYRHQVRNGTFPAEVSRAAEMAAIGTSPAMAESVTQWVTDAATERAKSAANVKRERRAIEASAETPVAPPSGSQTTSQSARQKPATDRAKARAKAAAILTANPATPLAEVSKKSGVSERTAQRIKSELPTRLHVAAP